MIFRLWLIAVTLLGLGGVARADGLDTLFEARTFKNSSDETLPYRLLKPRDYDPQKKYPLVLFMHAAMEKGVDNKKQLKKGVGVFATEENRTKYPAFVVAPQCPPKPKPQWVDVPWDTDSHVMPEEPSSSERLVLELLAALQTEFTNAETGFKSIDEKRIYVTGWSMGGFATWDLLMRRPALFAAGVPVCGGADDTKAGLITHIPVWVFHGSADTTVKTIRSRNIVEALRKAGGTPKYTEYEGVAHDSWQRAYAEAELLPWLFSQQRP